VSFILDALRKSEGERQRDSAPTLSQIPIAVPRAGVPQWVWVVMGLLSLCILILGGAWWQGFDARNSTTAPNPANSRLAGGVLPEAIRAVPSETTAIENRPAPATSGAFRAELGSPSMRDDSAADLMRRLPSIAEAQAAGLGLPPLELQLISFSENPAECFVFINGYQYRQGQRVQNGPLIMAIYSEGVVLRQGTRDFALLPN
jgi:hypothetical protein